MSDPLGQASKPQLTWMEGLNFKAEALGFEVWGPIWISLWA